MISYNRKCHLCEFSLPMEVTSSYFTVPDMTEHLKNVHDLDIPSFEIINVEEKVIEHE